MLALLEPDLRQRVRQRLTRRRIGAGKPLFRTGEAADALYLVDAGRFRILVGERVGKERVLSFLGPGEILGEVAFIADTPYTSLAVAVDDSSVWRLARADFDALLGQQDGLLRYPASLIAAGQSKANARLAAESAPDETRALRGFVTSVYSPRGGAGVTTLAARHPDDAVLLDRRQPCGANHCSVRVRTMPSRAPLRSVPNSSVVRPAKQLRCPQLMPRDGRR